MNQDSGVKRGENPEWIKIEEPKQIVDR